MRSLIARLLPAGLLVGCLTLAGPAAAQYNGAFGTTWNNPVSVQISYYIRGNMQSQALNNAIAGNLAFQSNVGKKGSGSTTAPKPAPKKSEPAPKTPPPPEGKAGPVSGTLTFKAIPARVLPAKLAAQYGKTPDEQKKLEGLIHQIINRWETEALTRQGLANFDQLHDLSKTVPYSLAVTHGVWRGNGAPPSKEMIAATQQTLGEQLRKSPDLAKLTDLQKQELYETQALMTFLLESGRENAVRSHSPDGERRIQAMAGEFVKAITGTEPDHIEISNDGFELKK